MAKSTKKMVLLHKKAKESTIAGIKLCIQSWCNKNGVTKSLLLASDKKPSHI